MNSEVEQLRADYAAMQKQYTLLCDMVRGRAQLIYGQAGNGNALEATALAADLLQFVTTARQQVMMHQEQRAPSAYDLAGLRVDTGQASNSETGWERED